MNIGIPVILVSRLPQDILQTKRIRYYESGKINIGDKPPEDIVEKLKPDLDKLYYRSMKIVASDGKLYDSHAAIEVGKTYQNGYEYNRVLDSPKIWEDLNFCIVVKKH
jgi:hypothetical protein